jgi:hypothetical protein
MKTAAKAEAFSNTCCQSREQHSSLWFCNNIINILYVNYKSRGYGLQEAECLKRFYRPSLRSNAINSWL